MVYDNDFRFATCTPDNVRDVFVLLDVKALSVLIWPDSFEKAFIQFTSSVPCALSRGRVPFENFFTPSRSFFEFNDFEISTMHAIRIIEKHWKRTMIL